MDNKNIDDQSIAVCHSRNPEGPNIPVMKLQVRKVSESVTAHQLRGLFKKYGLVLKCDISGIPGKPSREAIIVSTYYFHYGFLFFK